MALRARFRLERDDSDRIATRLRKFRAPLDRKTAQKLARRIIKEMKADIAKGINPITFGDRRFPAYKNPRKYPGRRKGARPVNLKLTGAFLKSLQFQLERVARDNYDVVLGFFDSLSRKKEEGHRDGANRQPKRPIIPEGNERFNARIQDIIVQIIDERYSDIARRRRP